MKDVNEAVKDLRKYLGDPPWLTSIGVGSQDDRPVIILYLSSEPKTDVPLIDDKVWHGHPVIIRVFGSFAPLGFR